MWYPGAVRNQVPASCFTKKRTPKSAVCMHRMAGWAPYMRTPHPEAVRRRISAHFTIDMKGGVQQHLDTDYGSHAQGIKQGQFAYARKYWPLFQNRSPNADVVSIELEDGGKPFSDERPMPIEQLMATVKLVQWLLKDVVKDSALINETVISHDILTTARYQDPGDWVMENLMGRLSATTPTLSPASRDLAWTSPKVPKSPSRRSKQSLRKAILSGKRKCSFNDAVYLGWIDGGEAKEWGRRVWYTLRKHNHSPLAPWQDGESLYTAICGTIMAESGGDPMAVNVNEDGPLPRGKRGHSVDRGLAQINDRWWPNVSDEQAFSPAFSVNFMVQHFPEHPKWWHGYTAYLKGKS